MRAIGARLLPCFQAGLSKEPRGRHRPRRAPFLTHATEQNRSIGPAAGGGRVRFCTNARTLHLKMALHTLSPDPCMAVCAASGADVFAGVGLESRILGFRESRGGISGAAAPPPGSRDVPAACGGRCRGLGFSESGNLAAESRGRLRRRRVLEAQNLARIRPRGSAARREPERQNLKIRDPEIPVPGSPEPGPSSPRVRPPPLAASDKKDPAREEMK